MEQNEATPVVGTIKRGREIGKLRSVYTRSKRYIFCRCPDCGKERWLIYRAYTASGTSRCQSCCGRYTDMSGRLPHGSGPKSNRWKGGKGPNGKGYVAVWVDSNDPYFPMAVKRSPCTGTVLEHRLVMAKHLGRLLASTEDVHHINGIKDDNRIENLELISPENHMLLSKICSGCKLRKQIKALVRENKHLKAQLPTML